MIPQPAANGASVPTWRLVAGAAVLAAMALLGIALAPVYLHNLEFQRRVADIAEQPATRDLTDDAIRSRLVSQAADLALPVHMEDIKIERSSDALRIAAKYAVHVNLLVYTVDLHFYPGAGSR